MKRDEYFKGDGELLNCTRDSLKVTTRPPLTVNPRLWVADTYPGAGYKVMLGNCSCSFDDENGSTLKNSYGRQCMAEVTRIHDFATVSGTFLLFYALLF